MYEFVDQPIDQLSRGSQLVLWAMRTWIHQLNEGRCPPAALAPGFQRLGIIDALPPFHKTMALLNHHAVCDFAFGHRASPPIGEDEAILLSVWEDAAHGNMAGAERTLAMLTDVSAAKLITSLMVMASRILSTKNASPNGLANSTAISVQGSMNRMG